MCVKLLSVLPVGRTLWQNCNRSLFFRPAELRYSMAFPINALRSVSFCNSHNLHQCIARNMWISASSVRRPENSSFIYTLQNRQSSKREFSAAPLLKSKSLGTKLVELAPESLQPYLQLTRIDKPTGTFLLLWPGLWSICLAAQPGSWPSSFYICIFSLGTILMRGAGCTINDMWDRKIDAQVERTRHRPLASGRIDFSDALGFLALQLGCATVLLLQLDWVSILLGLSSMGLVLSYPLAKRFTNWPQLVLGFTFNWGAVMAWSAVHGAYDWFLVLPLYAAAVSWTLVYDTIYAHQDRQDDAKLGIKSTALLFGQSSKKWLSLFSCSMLGNLLLTGIVNDLTWPFYASTGLVGLHLLTQVSTLDINNPENCARRFKSNAVLGLILFIGLVASNRVKEKEYSKKVTELT